MSFLIKLRNFFYILKIFYWLAFKGVVKAIFDGNPKNSQQEWARYIQQFLRFKIYKFRNSEEIYRQKSIVLSNHRSQADFWLHNIVTQNLCNFLSRMLVGIIFFVIGISGYKVVWFFNRSANIDHDKFNQWLNYKFSKSPRPSLLAYPEGHRMYAIAKAQKDKLKTGMIRYAYREKIPVQFLMTFGNQNVFNEKKLHIGWDQKVFYSFSKVFDPNNFQSQGEFVNFIKDEFCKYFDKIYQLYSQGGQAEEQNFFRNAAD